MTHNGQVPFVDLVTLHRELEPELLEVCKRVIGTAGFIGGPEVEGFEKEFARFCGAKYCVGVNSGTDALRFALMATGIEPGDIVLTSPHTFIATTEAISQAGGYPDFIDIDERTFIMDPAKLREYLEAQCILDQGTGRYMHKRLGRRVTAIVPVHLYGQMADMDAILELASRYKLTVVEDACQAHGAEYFSQKQNRWSKAGSIGRAAAFSFYPGKNLGACGEGGAITTNDEELARKCVMLRDHGSNKKYYHDIEGYNGRLDSIQAGMLRVKLKHLSTWNDQRRECAARYNQLLAQLPGSIKLPYEAPFAKSVYHLYVVCTANRKGLQDRLQAAGVGSGIHYPIPLHLQNAYSALNHRVGDFPVAEQAAAQVLSLPMYAGLSADQQSRVAETILEFASVHATQ